MKKAFYKTGVVAALTLLCAGNVNAASCRGDPTGYCISDGNASFSIDSSALMDFTVDGRTHVLTTDFLFDNQALKGQSASPLNITDYITYGQAQTQSNILSVVFDLGTWATLDVTYEVQGGGTNSDTATLIETFTVTNTSGVILDLNMFAYTDIDLGGSRQGLNDQGELVDFVNGQPISYRQFDADFQMLASVDVAPDFYEVGEVAGCANGDVCDRIYNGTDTTLLNTVDAGPTDLEMAAQWMRSLTASGAGSTFTYSQTIELSPISNVPVPAAVWLFGSGLLGLAGVARRKK